jgi:hypothetical protein
MNRRGVVETLVLLYIVGAFLAGVLLWKPATTLLGISNTPRKTSQSVIKKEEKKPIFYYTDEKGKNYIAYAYKNESSNINIDEQPKLTLWQKIQNLGIWGIILVILGCLFPPVGAVLMFIWKRVTGGLKTQIADISQKQECLSADAKKIVQSVDDGLAMLDVAITANKDNPEVYKAMVELKQKFLTALSSKQDATTKLLVAQLKHDDDQ